MSNIFYSPNAGIASQQWLTGLSTYTQANCQVTLTANGLRIYRPPNLNPTNNGNTMWGGMKIVNCTTNSINHTFNETDNFFNLMQGHTYIILFHVSGKSTNQFATFSWLNQMGWSGGGLNAAPSNVSYSGIPANFDGETDCFYKFTINDTIAKQCTSTYSYATAGNTYLSYTHFGVGFAYTNTGTLGTDIYITNLRMYDITNNNSQFSITKSGIIYTNGCTERNAQLTSIIDGKELYSHNLYEY